MSTLNSKINSNPKINPSPKINPNPNINPSRVWRASLRLSVGCRWSCWPYSQPRTGVVNRHPGIVSDRTPLARM